MEQNTVRVRCDVHTKSISKSESYRLYVNDEMFVERSFDIDSESCMRETLTMIAKPGRYLIWVRGNSASSKFHMKNLAVIQGPAMIDSDQYVIVT